MASQPRSPRSSVRQPRVLARATQEYGVRRNGHEPASASARPLVDPHGLRARPRRSHRRSRAPVRAVVRQSGPRQSADPRPATGRKSGARVGRHRRLSSPPCSGSHARRRDGWTRYGFDDVSGVIDVRDACPMRGAAAWGVGSVHHLAWRVDDDRAPDACARTVERRRAADRRSSIASGSSRSTSSNRAACSSSSRPTVRASRSTRTPPTSARRWCCRRGSSRTKPDRSRIADAHAGGLSAPVSSAIEQRLHLVLEPIAKRAPEGGRDVDEDRRRRHRPGDLCWQHNAIAFARETDATPVRPARSTRATT